MLGRERAGGAPPYEVGECLGGAVFRARAVEGSRAVALKTLRHLDARFAPQFQRDFEVVRRVRHPNLVELLELNLTSSSFFFYAMELVDGVDILRHLDHPGLPRAPRGLHADLGRLYSVMRQLADGIHALHEAGLRHDNLKPRNVLVTPHGRVVITDYSLSVPLAQYSTIDSASSSNTSSKYASPEQAGGGAITPASDWYSFGAILFEALTGRLAFATKQAAASKEPTLPSALVGDVPDEIDELCIRLLSRDPRRRARYDDVMRVFDVHDTQTIAADEVNVTHPRTRRNPQSKAPIDFPGTERFVINRCLGHGGMGVVYEAFDRERNMKVALKTLLRCDPNTIYRFKQEFRALVDVSHPNLVALYELVSTRGQWFFTMELLSGTDYVSYVRGRSEPDTAHSVDSGSLLSDPEMTRDRRASTNSEGRALGSEPSWAPIDWNRLRAATRQLAQGVRALHESGHMHRDIKPSNVLVTPEGRVVLLDFGVIAELGPARVAGTRELVGTPIYMAPEQAHGKVTKAGDWYSVGVMLYRVLTGATPYVGSTEQILFAKQELDPVSPDVFRSDLPPDLVALCMDLLTRDPDRRPSGAAVLAQLGSSPQSLSVNITARKRDSMSPGTTTLAGREAHMQALRDTFSHATYGTGQTLLVHGSSGMGKSVLIDHFLHEVMANPRSIVLTGRCYEREQVPYKGVDAVVDALSRYLMSLPEDEADSLAPRDLYPLAKVFPVLESVNMFARADRLAAAPEPQELRRRAFAALRTLLGRIATRGPLVVFIDDVQWGDRDSAPLLAQLMRPPDVPPMLLVLSYRTEDAPRSPLLQSLLTGDGLLAPGAHTRELTVGALSEDQARSLAQRLLENPSTEAAVTIARESRGHPYFVHELACHVNEVGFGEHTELSLDAVVAGRLERLSEPARRMLEIVAVGGQPLTQMLIGAATVVDNQERVTLINQLRVAHLVRTTGVGDDDLAECYHDRIRELIVSQMTLDRSVDSHRRIAIAMSDGHNPDPEALAIHFHGAGDGKRAFVYSTRAADRAAAMLAFDRAAHFYRLALELRPPADVVRSLNERLGDALRNAGRGVDAAMAYQAAVAGAPLDVQVIYRRLAAEQLLYSGHHDEGLVAIEEVLDTVGLRLAKTPRRAVISLLWGRLRLRLRGLKYESRAVSDIPPDELQRIDTCYAVGTSLSLVDTIRASAFQSLNLRLSLDSGEPYRIARSLALEAAFLSSMGAKMATRVEGLLETAKELAHSIGNPHATGLVILCSGICAYESGRIAECRSYSETAEEVLRAQCSGVAWELACARLFSTWSSYRLGDIASLVQRVPILEHEAEERGDLYSRLVMALGAPRIAMTLATDRPDQHRQITEEARAAWSDKRGYQIQHYWADTALLNIDLYDDRCESAWERVTQVWPQIRRALLFRVDEITIYMSEMRARVALAMATRARKRRKYLGEVDKLAHVLAAKPIVWCGAMASLLRAQVAALDEDDKLELSLLDKAQAGFAEAQLVPYEMVTQLRRGQLLGGAAYAAAATTVEAWSRAQGIANFGKFVRMLAPVYVTARRALSA